MTGSRDGKPLDREPYIESLAIWRAAGNQAGVAKALNGLGEAARESGDFAEARRCYEEALSLIEVRLLDHFIVGEGTCYSFSEHGLL